MSQGSRIEHVQSWVNTRSAIREPFIKNNAYYLINGITTQELIALSLLKNHGASLHGFFKPQRI